jgi:hypothetical protein
VTPCERIGKWETSPILREDRALVLEHLWPKEFRSVGICAAAKSLKLHAVPQLTRLVAGFLPRQPSFKPRSAHVGFLVDEVEMERVFFEYFGFPCQFSFYQLLYIHHHVSSGAGTIGKTVADVPNGLSLTRPQETWKKKMSSLFRQRYLPNAAICGLLMLLECVSWLLGHWGKNMANPRT